MSFKYKINVLEELKAKGYSSYKMRRDNTFNEATIQKLRNGEIVSLNNFCKLCMILDCDIGDIITFKKDDN